MEAVLICAFAGVLILCVAAYRMAAPRRSERPRRPRKAKGAEGYGVMPAQAREHVFFVLSKLAFALRGAKDMRTRYAPDPFETAELCHTAGVRPNLTALYALGARLGERFESLPALPCVSGVPRILTAAREIVRNTGAAGESPDIPAYMNFFGLMCPPERPFTSAEADTFPAFIELARFEYVTALLKKRAALQSYPKSTPKPAAQSETRLSDIIKLNMSALGVLHADESIPAPEKNAPAPAVNKAVCVDPENICSEIAAGDYAAAFLPMRLVSSDEAFDRAANNILSDRAREGHLRLLAAYTKGAGAEIVFEDVLRAMHADPLFLAEIAANAFSYRLRFSEKPFHPDVDRLAYAATIAAAAIKTCKRGLWSGANRNKALLVVLHAASKLSESGMLKVSRADSEKNALATLYLYYTAAAVLECERDAKYKLKLKACLTLAKKGLEKEFRERGNLLDDPRIYTLASLCGVVPRFDIQKLGISGLDSGFHTPVLCRQVLGLDFRVKHIRLEKGVFGFSGDFSLTFFEGGASSTVTCLNAGGREARMLSDGRVFYNPATVSLVPGKETVIEYSD